MEHHFNIEVAKKFGVKGAIILHNVYFWSLKNKANDKNFFNGRYWSYNSISAFEKLFPYWSKRQIEGIINKLIEKKALLKDNFNKNLYDRTLWYAVTENVISIYLNGGMEKTEMVNGNTQTVEPIPDSKQQIVNTDNKPYNNSENEFSGNFENGNDLFSDFARNDKEKFMELWKLYPAKHNDFDSDFKNFQQKTKLIEEVNFDFLKKYIKKHQGRYFQSWLNEALKFNQKSSAKKGRAIQPSDSIENQPLELPFNSIDFAKKWAEWNEYRKFELKKPYKSRIGEQRALSHCEKLSAGNESIAIEILDQSMGNGWQGLFELRKSEKLNNQKKHIIGRDDPTGEF